MNATVTGGTGFLGRTLVRLLVPAAETVRVLVRRPADEALIRALGAEPVRGELTTAEGCEGLVRPADVVYHLAARVSTTGAWTEFQRTTVEGTARLLEAALACRPARFVYVSSGAVYSVKHARGPVSADRTPVAPPRYNLYARAKLAAEQLVRNECERAGCPWTIVRLGCIVYGPGHSPLARTFVPLAQNGRLAVIGDGRNPVATLYVDDAARAVLLAGTHPAGAGKIYDAAGDEPVTQREFLDALSDAFGLARPARRVRRATAFAAAGLAECWAWLVGGEPALTRSLVALMASGHALETSRIREELEWRPQTSFEEGMRRMREWCSRPMKVARGAAHEARPVAVAQPQP